MARATVLLRIAVAMWLPGCGATADGDGAPRDGDAVNVGPQDRPPVDGKPVGPLAGLPSAPGAHLEKIKALGDNQWLNLGAPAPDPKWGVGIGRSWSAYMPYAADLGGAFLRGTGVHDFIKPDGYYGDDLFFYDVNAHRWICIYPGADTKTLVDKIKSGELKARSDGQMVDKDDQPVFYGLGGHAYLPTKKVFWVHAARATQTFFLDFAARRLTDSGTKGSGPSQIDLGGCYDSKRNRIYLSHRGIYIYDVADNAWTAPQAGGPGSFLGANGAAVNYDTAHDRVVHVRTTHGETETGTVKIFDPGSFSWKESFPAPAELTKYSKYAWNSFYSPAVNAHFFHIAHDSSTDGTMWVYRYKR